MTKEADQMPSRGSTTEVMHDAERTGRATMPRKQHCWECLRRRLVCDSATPTCIRCQKSGIVCPGYGDQKPLTWLAPGKVAYRRKRPLLVVPTAEATNFSPDKDEQGLTKPSRQVRFVVRPPSEKTGRARVSLMKQLKIDKALRDVFEAAQYFQEQILTTYLPMKDILPRASVSGLELASVRHFTPVIQHSFICIALGHRIHRMSRGTSPSELAALWELFFQSRGRALNALAESVVSQKGNVLATIVNIGMFLTSDVQHCYPGWHFHYEGAAKLINSCGGPGAMVSKMPPFSVAMNSFVLYGIFANATSHRHHQLAYNTPYPQIIDFVSKHFVEELIAFAICPRELLTTIVQVNYLRGQRSALSRASNTERDPDLSDQGAYNISPDQILSNLQAFSPAEWATSKAPNQPEVLLLACLLQSSTITYCIASLQSAGLFPSHDVELELTFALHRAAMFTALKSLLPTAKLLKGLSWPFTVAGYAAAQEGETEREFIRQWCVELSYRLGEAAPLSMLQVLERFWLGVQAGGRDGWDDCFDGKYCFIA